MKTMRKSENVWVRMNSASMNVYRRIARMLCRAPGFRVAVGCAALFALLGLGSVPVQAAQDSTLTGSGSWTVPAGVTSVQVWLWGGGGGGGGVKNTATNSGAGGGGGGAFTTNLLTGLIPGSTIVYTNGAAGTAGVTGGGNGGDGGDTTFAGCTTATKGSGGGGTTVSSTPGSGGAGGTVSGSGNYNGGNGATGSTAASGGGGGSAGSAGPGGNAGIGTPDVAGAAGAGTPGGGAGAAGKTTGANGGTPGAAAYGAGGSGALNLSSAANRPGGAGKAGKITLTYSVTYYSQGSSDATLTTSWNTERGGGGSDPTNFASGDTFVIQNGHSMTVGSAWTISGTGLDVKLQIENGGTLTATALISVPTFQVDNGGTYIHNAASVTSNGSAGDFPGTTRILGASSTVEIQKWANGGAAPVAFTAITGISPNWGNLTINVASLGGNWVQAADFTIGGNFVVQATGGTTRELQLSTSTGARTVTVGGNLSVSGGILNLSTSTGTTTLNVSGDVSASGGTLKATTATYGKINFAKSGTQTFTSGGTVNNIDWTVNSGATVSAGTSDFSGTGNTFTLNSGGGFSTTSASGINGNFSSLTPTLSTGGNYTFAGSAASAVTGNKLPTTVNGLTINNVNGVTLSGNITVTNTLTLTSGELIPGANTLALDAASTISGASASSFVRGSLVRTFNSGSGQSFTAPVGTSTKYRPVAVSALDVNIGGTLTFSTSDGDHADIANSGIVNTKSANCVWTVTPGGAFALDVGGYNLDLTWASGDLDGGANANNFVMKKYNGTWSSPAGVTASDTHTLGTGFTAFSDFIVGEAGTSASSSSDIIGDTGFTEPSNVVYTNYQTASGLTTGNAIELARFTIRDGGGASDADGLATDLSAIQFNVSNGSNLRRVALFVGGNNIAEIAGGTTLSFSSLAGLSAPDNGSTNFSLLATFNSNVTDNAQLQFTVTSATSGGSGSQFAAGNAGGAASSVGDDANRIEVTATKLAFSSVPASATQNVNFAAAVQAQDANGNVDLDDTTSVTVSLASGTGTLNGGNAQNLINGAKTFNGLSYDKVESITLQASGGSLATGMSSSFSVLATPPTASNDTAATIVNGAITISVTTNDLNFLAPIASATPVTWLGSTMAVTNGTNVLYTPAANSNGTDSFEYVITNAYGQSATGLVTVSVAVPTLRTWDGDGADDKWSTGANWDFDAAPFFPVVLTFAGTARPTPSNDYAGVTVNGIAFGADAGSFTNGGNAITLGGVITNGSSNPQTINLDINLGGSTRNMYGGAAGVTLGGVLSGTGGLTLPTSSGTLTLSGNNTNYTGNTTLATGARLNINHNHALGAGTLVANNLPEIDNTSGGLVTITNTVTPGGNSLTFIGSNDLTINSTYTIPNNRTLTVNGGTLTIKTVDAGATTYVLTKNGAGALAITDAAGATFQGGFTLSAGTLILGHKNAIGSGLLSLNGGTLEVSADLSGANAIANAIQGNNQPVSFGGANNITFTGAVGITGAKTLTSSLAAGRTLTFSGSVTNSYTSAYTLTLGGTGATTFSGAIANGAASAVSLLINNTAVTTLSGANTYSGATTINNGIVKISGQTGTDSGTGANNTTTVNVGTFGGSGRSASQIVIADTNVAALYPNGNFSGATLTCGSNITFNGANALAKFDLSSSALSGNDKVVLENKTLTCNGATVVINSAGTLDTTDYTLFDVGALGSISGAFAATPVWAGTAPANSNQYSISQNTTNVYLHYTAANPPVAVGDTAATSVNTPVTINVTTNDSAFNPPIAGLVSDQMWAGSSIIVTNGTNVFYTPAADSVGSDTFGYVITNAYGAATGTVTVTITSPSLIWDGGGSDDKWSTGTNWNYDAAPAFPAALTFAGTTRTTPSNDYVGVTVSGITFSATAQNFFLNGNKITLAGNITGTQPTQAALVTNTIAMDMDLGGATRTVTAPGTASTNMSIALNGVISGSGGLTKATSAGSTAVLALNGLNTFSGKLTAQGWVVINSIADSNTACAAGMAGSIAFNGGTLSYVGGAASCNRQLEIGPSTTNSGNGASLLNNGGALTFTASPFNLVPGAGIINARTFSLGGTGTGTNEIQGAIQDNNTGGNGVVNVTLGGVTIGAGTWRLSAANTYSGITTIQYGSILEAATLANGGSASGVGASGNAAANLVFGTSGGTLRYVGGANPVTDRAFTYPGTQSAILESSGAGTVTFDTPGNALAYASTSANASLTLGGSNTGTNTFGKNLVNNPADGSKTLSLTKTGAGRWILTADGNNTYSGDTTLSGGALEVGNNAGSLSVNSGLKLDGGVLQAYGSFARVNDTGAGNIQWSSANGGGFSARGGALTVTLSSGTEQIWGTAAGANRLWGTLMFGSVSADSETRFQNGINLNNLNNTPGVMRTVDVAAGVGGDYATLAGVIRLTGTGSSTAGLIKTGAGTLSLSAANTYNGGTSVSNGALRVDNASGSGTGSGMVSVYGGTLGGTGRVAGVISIADTNAAALYPQGNFAGATLTCGSNVTFAGSNSRAKFDLSPSVSSGNDKVILENKTLTCGGAAVLIHDTGTLAAGDYVLFDVGASGNIVGSFAATPLWVGTPPTANQYRIIQDTRYVFLHWVPPGSTYSFR